MAIVVDITLHSAYLCGKNVMAYSTHVSAYPEEPQPPVPAPGGELPRAGTREAAGTVSTRTSRSTARQRRTRWVAVGAGALLGEVCGAGRTRRGPEGEQSRAQHRRRADLRAVVARRRRARAAPRWRLAPVAS